MDSILETHEQLLKHRLVLMDKKQITAINEMIKQLSTDQGNALRTFVYKEDDEK